MHKIINITVGVMVDFEASKCECQLKTHEWVLTPTFPRCMTEWRCKHCGETKPLTDADRKKFKIPTKKEYFNSLKTE